MAKLYLGGSTENGVSYRRRNLFLALGFSPAMSGALWALRLVWALVYSSR